ncbi:hypothetical protein JTE90_000940 [Oedothorax gibbosus]|uniref:Sulfotransferase domain-containing protein n=1 Tax=Oedothorax gibbosus TaxID=931172 RepID=A0AAV6U685_9ARAC|nr:hypothetical protein JTE90_000940 [Oedothorax gibbosus]
MEPAASRKSPTYYVHENGFIMPNGFKPEHFYSAQAYVPTESDIFIATYPKCGTTWTQYILYLLKNRGSPLEPGQNINQFIPHIEEVGKEVIEALAEPRTIKTHLPYNFAPISSKAKYICVARNPKDCCVSYYHHTKGFTKYYKFEDGTFDDYFELFLEGKVDYGDYFDHLLSWFEHRDDPNVLFLLYEEMKADTVGSVRRIGEFLGGDFLRNVQDSAVLEQIVTNITFEKMKATPSMWSSERPKKFEAFIRKGKVGDWRTHFSEEQSNRLDEQFNAKLLGTKAEKLWERFDC